MLRGYSKKIFVLLLFVMMFYVPNKLKAQYLENEPTKLERIFWGGNLGLMFGSYTYIAADPVVGYRLTNRLSMGIGGNYAWSKIEYNNYSGHTYGANVFASFTIIKNLGEFIPGYNNSGILLYGELSWLNVSDLYSTRGNKVINWVYSPLAGFAYQSPIGERSYLLFMLLFNFNESYTSPYSNPVLKVSMQF